MSKPSISDSTELKEMGFHDAEGLADGRAGRAQGSSLAIMPDDQEIEKLSNNNTNGSAVRTSSVPYHVSDGIILSYYLSRY